MHSELAIKFQVQQLSTTVSDILQDTNEQQLFLKLQGEIFKKVKNDFR
jgi:hypothetical protein